MISNSGLSFLARLRRTSEASAVTISISWSLTLSPFAFASIKAHIFLDRSTNTTCDAPRESASIPTAPDPAQRSRNWAPSIRGARILKSVSRKRSDVGRVCSDGGLFSLRPRYLPAMIRINHHPQITQIKQMTKHNNKAHKRSYFLWNPCNLRISNRLRQVLFAHPS